MEPSLYPLSGFILGKAIEPLGQIELLMTFGTMENHRTEKVRFNVVDVESSFNKIMRRVTFNRFCAAVHHNFLCLKIPSPQGHIIVRGERSQDRKILHLQEFSRTDKATPKTVNLLAGTEEPLTTSPKRFIPKPHPVKIGADLPRVLQENLVALLQKNSDLFPWSANDMGGTLLEVIQHHLTVKSDLPLVK